MTFGVELRRWRTERGVSQLRLASTADVSQRHISFLENGRAQPSREMVLHLSRVLQVPLDERNHLLVSAGLAPEFSSASAEDLAEVGDALSFMLNAHEPNMAIVIDSAWNLVMANDAALTFTAFMAPDPPLFQDRLNVMYAIFHPEGLGAHVINRAEVEPMLLWRLAAELEARPADEALRSLVTEVRLLASFPQASVPAHRGLVATTRFNTPVGELAMFSCLAAIESPNDVTVSGLRLETFFPADAQSSERWLELLDREGAEDVGRR